MSAANDERGVQRLSRERLAEWESLGFGMFIHFGMSTFDNDEFSRGDKPSTTYAPGALDPDQWVSVARDAGCRYAVLTAKHVAGHSLWPTAQGNYHVGTSSVPRDVVAEFMTACRRRGIMPGLYYCCWDNHNRFGSATPTFAADGGPGSWDKKVSTPAYEEFMLAQLEELTAYGECLEWWIDIPGQLNDQARHRVYDLLASRQPRSLILMNQGYGTGGKVPPHTWPTDLVNYETELPHYGVHPGASPGHDPWRVVGGKRYYLPCEICDTVSPHWFWAEADSPKCDQELLGVALLSRTRRCNLLLDVGPDRRGLVPEDQIQALMRLRKNLDLVG